MTAGPTHEPIDPVRFIGNRSSGKMGVAIAAEALGRGAARPPDPRARDRGPARPGAELVRVTTAEEMRARGARRGRGGADAVVMAAAVADFRPKDAPPTGS